MDERKSYARLFWYLIDLILLLFASICICWYTNNNDLRQKRGFYEETT